MKHKIIFKVIEFGLAAVLLVSLGMYLRTQMEYAQGASSYEDAADLARLPKYVPASADHGAGDPGSAGTDPYLVQLTEMDFAELRQTNPDVLGWIVIPETVLSYPLLQGVDNDYYLNHLWQGRRNTIGAIFMDFRSDADLSDFNTIIYGHRMRDGSMFDSLRAYEDQEHWRTHPSVYLACDNCAYRYDIFAAYEAEANVSGPVYSLSYRSADDREAFIESCLEQSKIESGIVPTIHDQILTLSTCADRGYATRWVVQAVLAESYASNDDHIKIG